MRLFWRKDFSAVEPNGREKLAGGDLEQKGNSGPPPLIADNNHRRGVGPFLFIPLFRPNIYNTSMELMESWKCVKNRMNQLSGFWNSWRCRSGRSQSKQPHPNTVQSKLYSIYWTKEAARGWKKRRLRTNRRQRGIRLQCSIGFLIFANTNSRTGYLFAFMPQIAIIGALEH